MHQVITAEQAKQITGGRAPLVPVEYEAAIRALQECINLDEAKTWSDKADALAAWAKIYRDDKTGRQAKILKLHAYRRMGQLAGELRPVVIRKGYVGSGPSKSPGPLSILVESGLKKVQGTAARRLAAMSEEKFFDETKREIIRSPLAVQRQNRSQNARTSPAWHAFSTDTLGPFTFRSWCRRNEPVALARFLLRDEKHKAKELVTEISEWADAFLSVLADSK